MTEALFLLEKSCWRWTSTDLQGKNN